MILPKFIIISGPSCIGKGPLLEALRRVYPELAFGQPVRYTSRIMRPGERDGVEFHFRSATDIRALPPERYFIYPMRNNWQALDLNELDELFSRCERIITECYPPVVLPLLEHPRVLKAGTGWETRTVFLTPLTDGEIAELAEHAPERPMADIIADIMRAKQIRRAVNQGKPLSREELDDIDVRAGQAYAEMQYRRLYSDVIVNHDGEDSEHWRSTPPLGDAGRTLHALARIMRSDELMRR
jgi:guanylate kinase